MPVGKYTVFGKDHICYDIGWYGKFFEGYIGIITERTTHHRGCIYLTIHTLDGAIVTLPEHHLISVWKDDSNGDGCTRTTERDTQDTV